MRFFLGWRGGSMLLGRCEGVGVGMGWICKGITNY